MSFIRIVFSWLPINSPTPFVEGDRYFTVQWRFPIILKQLSGFPLGKTSSFMLCHRGAVKKSDVTLRELSLVLRTGEKPSKDHIFRAWHATRGLRKPWDTREPASLKAWSRIIKILSLLRSCSLRCHIRVPWGSGLVGAGMFPDLRFNCAENREKFSDRNKSSPCDSPRMFQRVLHPSEVFGPLFFFVQLQFLPVQLKSLVDCNFAVGWIIYPVWLIFFHDSYLWSIGGQTHNYRLTWCVISHYLYNKLSYARILIGSHLWSLGGQTYGWRHH